MKKAFSLIMALALVLVFAAVVCAAKGATVYVTIINAEPVLVRQAVELSDIDGDGALTINDALYLAHEAGYEGGAAAGYASAQSDWGLSLAKLWGVENGGSYGYYVNDGMANGLTDALTDGDEIVAFVYTDTAYFSDAYSYFDQKTCADGAELTFYLCGFDENWALVSAPAAGAEITIDGVKTGIKTDANGKARIYAAEKGEHVVSAVLDGTLIVPPVSVLTKRDSSPKTGDTGIIALAIIGALSLAAFAAAKSKKG